MAIDAGIPIGQVRIEESIVPWTLLFRGGRTQVKIEVTPVLRGCVQDLSVRAIPHIVEQRFGYTEIQVVSFVDLYAGK